jgi:xanthine/uracil/vitamin C permease (AzgA family)
VTRESSVWPYIGVGCFTAPIGFFGGGMIAVLVAKVVGAVQGCMPPDGYPACNTWEFLLPGALLGLVGLPMTAILRLRRGRKTPTNSSGTS